MNDYFERFVAAIKELNDVNDIVETLKIADRENDLNFEGDIEDIIDSMSNVLECKIESRNISI